LGIGIDICTYRGIGKESFPRSSAQFCGAILLNSARISLMARFWRSFCLNRAQYRVILAAVIIQAMFTKKQFQLLIETMQLYHFTDT
jgi:hypothetical protein